MIDYFSKHFQFLLGLDADASTAAKETKAAATKGKAGEVAAKAEEAVTVSEISQSVLMSQLHQATTRLNKCVAISKKHFCCVFVGELWELHQRAQEVTLARSRAAKSS
jgi:hypothetical protein